jgi:hypothetical protein
MESRCKPAETSFAEEASGLDEKEEDAVIPSVFDRNSIQEIASFQSLVLKRAYPWLNCDELVEDEKQVERVAMRCEPGSSTSQAPSAPLIQVPAAPMHEALENKMTANISHYLAKQKGASRGREAPSTMKLATLTRPQTDLKKLVAFKKSVASRIQGNLVPTEAELRILEAYAPFMAKVSGSWEHRSWPNPDLAP